MSDAGLRLALQRIWHGEHDLESHLRAMAQRQAAEHEVHHVSTDLTRWSTTNAEQIVQLAHRHEVVLEPTTSTGDPGGPWASREESSLRLLEDLCQTYLLASSNSLAWEMLAQLGQATQQEDIVQLASGCHPQTLRQLRWANTMLKTASPQALAAL